MKLISSSESTVTTTTFQIDFDGRILTYIEYLNEKGKVIDCNFRDEIGNELDEPDNLEKIQDFVDKIEGE